jgi:uncharacterized protein YdaU (DUF1376 family)
MNFYPRHLGDYARDAGHLSLAEHGAYTLLLDRYYASERPIGREEAFRICHANSKTDRAAVTRVLQEFFQWTEEGYRNKRADEEILWAKEKSKKAKASASLRWNQGVSHANGMRTHSERNADAMLSNNQYPITNNQGALACYSDQPKAATGKVGTTRISKDSVLGVIGFSEEGKR